ncbi:M61 family metallopeptidase [Croceicoccus sediminis]|uniref:M61 family metallopeptidase n=1 Tax=Croceicoccus sediminis TaxID=2571150 RepID=UPI001F1041EE|nr:peptidase M61 [Croceicoccus sediminis]
MKPFPMIALLAASAPLALTTAPVSALAQTQAEEVRSLPAAGLALSQDVPDPFDTPYPGGTITIDVDATDLARGLFRTTETIPVAPGTEKLTLLYPQWRPGEHEGLAKIRNLNGIRFTVDGKDVAWERDPVELYAFHLDLPEGASEVVAHLVYTSPLRPSEGRIVMTPEMLNLKFEEMTLYPAGHYVRRIAVKPTVTFPAGWDVATALDGMARSGDTVTWAQTDYQTLVDSPIFAGEYHREWDLGHDARLQAFAHDPEELEASDERIASIRALVDEAVILFGNQQWDHYDFLLGLTDDLGDIGLEHHRSSENTLPPDTFEDWEKNEYRVDLLPHELVHSWNGKFRRPVGSWTPDYRQPTQNELLWVYEGQTQYWDLPLSVRSGMQSKAMVLGEIARSAAEYVNEPGRAWRSLADTTNDPQIGQRAAKPYYSYARGEEYYNEGALVWLEADMLIRSETNGRKSLDDFAKLFFGGHPGDWGEITYDFGDVVDTLNAVHPHDWATFLRERVYAPGAPAPLKGIQLGGYELVFKDEPNPFDASLMAKGALRLEHSLGMVLNESGTVTSVIWDGVAFKAGIVSGAEIVAVNGKEYSAETMKKAITAARESGTIDLLVKRGGRYTTVSVAYDGGLRWPWLEKAVKGTAHIDRWLEPRR